MDDHIFQVLGVVLNGGTTKYLSCVCSGNQVTRIVCLFCFRYGTGTLTTAFLDRVFQECLTYDGEMVRGGGITLSQAHICKDLLLGPPHIIEN